MEPKQILKPQQQVENILISQSCESWRCYLPVVTLGSEYLFWNKGMDRLLSHLVVCVISLNWFSTQLIFLYWNSLDTNLALFSPVLTEWGLEEGLLNHVWRTAMLQALKAASFHPERQIALSRSFPLYHHFLLPANSGRVKRRVHTGNVNLRGEAQTVLFTNTSFQLLIFEVQNFIFRRPLKIHSIFAS